MVGRCGGNHYPLLAYWEEEELQFEISTFRSLFELMHSINYFVFAETKFKVWSCDGFAEGTQKSGLAKFSASYEEKLYCKLN